MNESVHEHAWVGGDEEEKTSSSLGLNQQLDTGLDPTTWAAQGKSPSLNSPNHPHAPSTCGF